MLIDEADVFLQRRAELSLERNRLVAVFLRKLEHFEGILILTTNLVDHFDSAILDRMHLQIEYHPLDKAAKKAVITGFLKSLCGPDGFSNFGDNYLDRFANMKVNGRQVRLLDDTKMPKHTNGTRSRILCPLPMLLRQRTRKNCPVAISTTPWKSIACICPKAVTSRSTYTTECTHVGGRSFQRVWSRGLKYIGGRSESNILRCVSQPKVRLSRDLRRP